VAQTRGRKASERKLVKAGVGEQTIIVMINGTITEAEQKRKRSIR
jgi:hypothetical protein